MRRRKQRRRGIVLLIILSLLTMFVLIGVAFVVVAGQYRRGATANLRKHRVELDGRQYTDAALYQLLRDTPGRSSIHQHALLTDLYGNDGLRAVVTGGALEVDGQIVRINFRRDGRQPFGTEISDRPDYYNGAVLTMLEGPAAGKSTRILDYFVTRGPDGNWGQSGVNDNANGATDELAEAGWPGSDDTVWVTVERFDTDLSAGVLPNVGDRFLINGHPFNGTGAGFHPGSGNLDAAIPLSQGADNQWGRATVDDDGDGTTDNATEAGWPGSDDLALPVALLPHYKGNIYPGTAAPFAVGLGGQDESFDTADYQNVFLARVSADPRNFPDISPSFHPTELVGYWYQWVSDYILTPAGLAPSLHPAAFMYPYGVDQIPGNGDDPPIPAQDRTRIVDIKRMCLFRPLPEDNPLFTGSNPLFNPFGPLATPPFASVNSKPEWDVDNDGDGIKESIWIDIGLPAYTDRDGRRFRPLVAIYCQDLDGRLNLNANGNLAHKNSALSLFAWHPGRDGKWGIADVDDDGDGTVDEADEAGKPATSDDIPIAPYYYKPGTTPLPRGRGMGPAEVSLDALFGTNTAEYQNVLDARYTSRSGKPLPGKYNGFDDDFSLIKQHEVPQYYPWTPGADGAWGVANADDDGDGIVDNFTERAWPGSDDRRGGYSNAPDVRGIGAMAQHLTGQPGEVATGLPGETIDDPYEALLPGLQYDEPTTYVSPGPDGNWGHRNVDDDSNGTVDDFSEAGWPGTDDIDSDAPYLLRDLEQLLRWHDPDAARLQSRLVALAPNTFSSLFSRHLVTTHSSHLAVPGLTIPTDARNLGNAGHSPRIIDLFASRMSPGLTTAQRYKTLRTLIPFDLLHGQLFDLNRPFGNGRDDNGNGIVDEPLEATGEFTWTDGRLVSSGFRRSTIFSRSNDDPLWNPSLPLYNDQRQSYARALYVMLWFLRDTNTLYDLDSNNGNDVAETAYIFAQWAVNAVDFRDPDSIMTAFEFDLNPFNGWHVDGNPLTDEGSDGIDNDGDGATDEADERRGLVFGCERPELLITETGAFHDRRTEDLDSPQKKIADPEDDGANDYDQRLMPRGSFFVELYNPWTGNSVPPPEFYGSTPGVRLNQTTPGGSPVFRLLIVKGAGKALNPDDPEPTRRPSVSDMERSVYCTPPAQVPPALGPGHLRFSTTLPVAPLLPGNYAVIGSAGDYVLNLPDPSTGAANGVNDYVTPIGRRTDANETGGVSGLKIDQTKRIQLEPHANPTISSAWVQDNPNTLNQPANTTSNPPPGRRAVGIAINSPRSLDISEPIDMANAPEFGYPKYTAASPGPAGEIWDPALAAGDGAFNPPLDEPLDRISAAAAGADLNAVSINGTTGNFRTVHLQRLADPTLDYNPFPGEPGHDPTRPLNPYRTIDSMAVSLTAFNGINDDSSDNEWINDGPMKLQTLQRGEFDTAAQVNQRVRQLWAHEPLPALGAGDDPATNTPNHVFGVALNHSLGFLNYKYQPYVSGGSNTGAPAPVDAANQPMLLFPWLPFHNRPFVSPLELLQVPRSSSYDLLRHYATTITPPANPREEKYDGPNAADYVGTYGHLLNFFHAYANNGRALHLYRIFDLVHTPSPFVGSERYLHPILFAFDRGPDGRWGQANVDDNGDGIVDNILDAGAGDDRALPHPGNDGQWGVATVDDDGDGTVDNFSEAGWPGTDDYGYATMSYRPPFNKIPRREPGRININTMAYTWNTGADGRWGVANSDDDGNGVTDDVSEAGWYGSDDFVVSPVWEGIAKLFPEMDSAAYATKVVRSLQHFDETTYPANNIAAGPYPAKFNNPFRSMAAGDVMPNTLPPGVAPNAYPHFLRLAGVEASFLRRDPDGTATDRVPMFASSSTQNYRHTNRDHGYRWQGMERLPNLLSTHSNVYAVWITVGYFQLEPNPGGADPAHPDGFRLAEELGFDSGEILRHRAFYLIDRSIPVAFEPGENHNVDRAILIRRMLD